MSQDDEVAAVIAAAVALLAAQARPPASPAPARWRLAARLGDGPARNAPASVRSRWSAAGRAQ